MACPELPRSFLSHWRAPGTRDALAARSNHKHTHAHCSLIFFRKTENHTSNQLLPQQSSSDCATIDARVSCHSPATPPVAVVGSCGGIKILLPHGTTQAGQQHLVPACPLRQQGPRTAKVTQPLWAQPGTEPSCGKQLLLTHPQLPFNS